MAGNANISPRCRLRAARLTPREQLCLSLWCWDCLSLRQIADRLGIRKTSAQNRIDAARTKLARVGLRVRRLEVDSQTQSLDPAQMDALGPDQIKAKW